MSTTKVSWLIAVVACLLASGCVDSKNSLSDPQNSKPDISEAPKAIQELSAAIQGKNPIDVRAAIIDQIGAPQRDIGSGLIIEQWDISNGVLTFHPVTGPTFFDPKTKKSFWLLRTTNPVRVNLLQSYEMSTQPDLSNHGTCYWLGNVKVRSDMTYQFEDSGQHRDQRGAQTENFFHASPCWYGRHSLRRPDFARHTP
jgi:hypothetical protein